MKNNCMFYGHDILHWDYWTLHVIELYFTFEEMPLSNEGDGTTGMPFTTAGRIAVCHALDPQTY